jgi:hypothetical protein
VSRCVRKKHPRHHVAPPPLPCALSSPTVRRRTTLSISRFIQALALPCIYHGLRHCTFPFLLLFYLLYNSVSRQPFQHDCLAPDSVLCRSQPSSLLWIGPSYWAVCCSTSRTLFLPSACTVGLFVTLEPTPRGFNNCLRLAAFAFVPAVFCRLIRTRHRLRPAPNRTYAR